MSSVAKTSCLLLRYNCTPRCSSTNVHLKKQEFLRLTEHGWGFMGLSRWNPKSVTLEGLYPEGMAFPWLCKRSSPFIPLHLYTLSPPRDPETTIRVELRIASWEERLDPQLSVPLTTSIQEGRSTINRFSWKSRPAGTQEGDGRLAQRIILHHNPTSSDS